MDAVGADEHVACCLRTVVEPGRDPAVGADRGVRESPAELDRDPAPDRLIEEEAGQLRALQRLGYGSVRKRLAQSGRTEALALAVPEDVPSGRQADLLHEREDPDSIERIEAVRRDRQVGPHLAAGRRVRLEDRRLDPGAVESQGRHGAGDTPAGDQHSHGTIPL